jgi:hypothetical protein
MANVRQLLAHLKAEQKSTMDQGRDQTTGARLDLTDFANVASLTGTSGRSKYTIEVSKQFCLLLRCDLRLIAFR